MKVKYEYDVVNSEGDVISWGSTRQEARMEKAMIREYNPDLKTKIVQRKYVMQSEKEVR